ncbi:DUF1801 domain-containing protein [Ramlibacter sp. G-1-2-2]|uniref:DUF1801 domain-containing protein n=1 Tax=Ramlibacter agri TaxID=2728837 RepID=A0A848H8I0_9BURK|nr:DUF1801 domain-containing protein [Ramlibacter agri]NML46262.1 DUF1801 domain-containing protein [Ramlibacter agri]
MDRLFRFATAVKQDPAVSAWLHERPGELGAIARHWFETLRACGDDIRELMHDGQATACVADAAFAYVAVYKAHVDVGFFLGAQLPDPASLLEGTGKFMRHVKLGPGREVDSEALMHLISLACRDMQARVHAGS